MAGPIAISIKDLVLYADNRLPCPQRVLLTAAELGIDLHTIPIDVLDNEHKASTYTALNPTSTVPFLSTSPAAHIAFSLRESRAISRYLCLLTPGQALLPAPHTSSLEAVAHFEEAASIELTSFDPVANRLAFEALFKPRFGGCADGEVVRELRGRLEAVLDGLERTFTVGADGARAFMAGDDFTLADVFYVPYMLKLVELYGETLFEGRRGLEGWWRRVAERDSVVAIARY